MTVSANATDNAGMASVQFVLDPEEKALGRRSAGRDLGTASTGTRRVTGNGARTDGGGDHDTSGNTATSTAVSVTVNNPVPVISGVNATSVTASSATINWSTDKAADSQVAYGTTAAYGTTSALVSVLSTAHAVNLTGLTAATTYHYQVLSRDAQGESYDFRGLHVHDGWGATSDYRGERDVGDGDECDDQLGHG